MQHKAFSFSVFALMTALAVPAQAQEPPPAWTQHLVAVPRGPDLAPDAFTQSEAPSLVNQRVLDAVELIASNLRSTRYVHSTNVNLRQGRFDFDCSGMLAWILQRSAPRALASLKSHRPLAADFARAFETASTRERSTPWRRIARLEDARAGDILAWKRPPWFPSRNTGHVVVILAAPVRVPGMLNLYLVRVADSTSSYHEDDDRAQRGGGFGVGTLLIPTDPTSGAGTAYGWFGGLSQWVVPTSIVVGRATR